MLSCLSLCLLPGVCWPSFWTYPPSFSWWFWGRGHAECFNESVEFSEKISKGRGQKNCKCYKFTWTWYWENWLIASILYVSLKDWIDAQVQAFLPCLADVLSCWLNPSKLAYLTVSSSCLVVSSSHLLMKLRPSCPALALHALCSSWMRLLKNCHTISQQLSLRLLSKLLRLLNYIISQHSLSSSAGDNWDQELQGTELLMSIICLMTIDTLQIFSLISKTQRAQRMACRYVATQASARVCADLSN